MFDDLPIQEGGGGGRRKNTWRKLIDGKLK